MKRSRSEYVIQTVTNALKLLEEFRDEECLGVTELSRRLDLHKNNVFRLLATLEQSGYVEQCPESDRYRMGPGCMELGHFFTRNRSLSRLARPALEALARESGESAHLGSLEGFQVVHLDGEVPARTVVTSLRVGRRSDAHCTALGKVLLASGSGAQRERLADGLLPACTPSTITDPDKLLDHLRSVASQGYALDLEEWEVGLCCVAAPVHDALGNVVAGLSVSGPSFRLPADRLLGEVAPQVVAAAEALSRALGWVGDRTDAV